MLQSNVKKLNYYHEYGKTGNTMPAVHFRKIIEFSMTFQVCSVSMTRVFRKFLKHYSNFPKVSVLTCQKQTFLFHTSTSCVYIPKLVMSGGLRV